MVEGYVEEDLEEEKLEEQAEQEQEAYSYPDPPRQKDDLYSLFKWIIKKIDSSKIGNLNKEELGMLNISVRDCQKIALLADSLGHPAFGKFFKAQGEITLATSLSKKGHLVELFVTSQKKTFKSREFNLPPQPQEKKKGIFRR